MDFQLSDMEDKLSRIPNTLGAALWKVMQHFGRRGQGGAAGAGGDSAAAAPSGTVKDLKIFIAPTPGQKVE